MSEINQSVSVELGAPDPRVTVSSALYVVVDMRGPVLPRYDDHTGILLGIESLLLLESLLAAPKSVTSAIGEIENTLGFNATAQMSFVEELRRRDLLVAPGEPRAIRPEAQRIGDERPVAPDEEFVFVAPSILAVSARGFEHVDFAGEVIARLSARELHAATRFISTTSQVEALAAHREDAGDGALSNDEFHSMLRRLSAAGLLIDKSADDSAATNIAVNRQRMKDNLRRARRIRQFDATRVEEFEEAEREFERDTGRARTRVIGLDGTMQPPPLALACLVAYGKAFEGGRLNDSYSWYPRFFVPDEDAALIDALASASPAVFMFSDYIWSLDRNLGRSQRVKALNAGHLVVHGGPSAPKYEEDAEEFFRLHPHIDVIVRGEGEETFARLLAALEPSAREGRFDLEALAGVEGLTYRTEHGVRRNPDRDRIIDLDTIPSPILTGLLDGYAAGPVEHIVLETNRGCPYGCTFCDWGSATASRIRQFDQDRVNAELDWIGRNHIWNIGIADANFGIFARDVEFAERIVQLKLEHGFPGAVGPNYAKNTVKHLRPIIEAWADAGILAEGKVSLQSMDDETLRVIRRKNIKTEKYDQLAEEFRENHLPLSVDIMMGLPGSTVESFQRDMQGVINRDVMAVIHETQLLANSPMNDSAYRAEHGIVASVGDTIRSTKTFSEADWVRMNALRTATYMFDTAGVLRVVAKYLRHETGAREIDFYAQLIRGVLAEPERWPALTFALRAMMHRMLPPASWRLLIDDVHDFIRSCVDVADDDALASVLAVQHAVLPMAGREFPYEIALSHDVGAWHTRLMEIRGAGHHDDWERQDLPGLREFEPASFRVEDPADACTHALGQNMGAFLQHHRNWDLKSAVARAQIEPTTVAV